MPEFLYLGGDRGKGMLESALAQPRQTFGGIYLYRTIFDKAAALLCSIIKNHALVDGNKRTGLATVSVFLALNGYLFYPPMAEAIEHCVKIAETQGTRDQQGVARWLRSRSLSYDKYLLTLLEGEDDWSGAEEHTRAIIRNLVDIARAAK